MANTSFNVVDLDFDTQIADLKAFLSEHPVFKDYDFEGSNLKLLTELLAYNTHKNAFLTNMLFSEAFLDSAQLRGVIASHAKELNYLPRSTKSSKARITCTFTATGESAPYTIFKGSPLTALVKNTSYVFTLPETLTVSSSNTTFQFTTDIYEGIYIKDSYPFLPNIENQRFRITNKNVDVDSITVVVYEDGAQVGSVYTRTDTLLGIKDDSKVFFLQMGLNGYYEVLFGDNIFGRQPKNNSVIVIDYRVSAGSAPNGAAEFSLDFDPTGSDELTSVQSVEVLEAAAGGGAPETNESIRRYAPRYFATQQRAVATDDYSSLILSRYGGSIDDVTVYGGEQLEPKLYGRVVVALKPKNGTIAPDLLKNEIALWLLNYVSIPTRVIIDDPEYLYAEVTTQVQYDKYLTSKTANEIRGIVESTISDYATNNLEKFGEDFRYSKFVREIDDADVSIVSNDTTTRLAKRIAPRINYQESYVLEYGNQFHPARRADTDHPVVVSSIFTYQDDDGNNFTDSYVKDNGQGKLVVMTTSNGDEVMINNDVGSVDHTKGKVTINKLRVSDYTDHISIFATIISKDIIVNKNRILMISPDDITVTVVEKQS
jgi:hypothetical protein